MKQSATNEGGRARKRANRRAALALAFIVSSLSTSACLFAAPDPARQAPSQMVLVAPAAVTALAVAHWKEEGFKGAAIVLDDQVEPARLGEIGQRLAQGGLEGYGWIEVARNPRMATAHPRWMAALGMHQDWQRNFPNLPEAKAGEVAKAFPWVPLGYQESFDAHLARVEQLLKRMPDGWRGVLLNDLQGGPSSCGCGNLQCRWAIDYGVRSTATKLTGDDVAARFVAEARRLAGAKLVVPVWTTECEEVDLPAAKHQGRPGTGLCGTVGCATGTCPEVFTRQWSALAAAPDGPIALLGLHLALRRTQPDFGGGPAWAAGPSAYLRRMTSAGGAAVAADRVWVVLEGADAEEEALARERASTAGAATVIVARIRLDQSYEPRLIKQ